MKRNNYLMPNSDTPGMILGWTQHTSIHIVCVHVPVHGVSVCLYPHISQGLLLECGLVA